MTGCCNIKTVFGRSLAEGAKFVSVSTIILGSVFFTISFATTVLQHTSHWDSKNVVTAVYYVSSLVVTSLSFYQIVISSILLWILLKTKGNVFIGSVWYVSHLSIISIYFMMFTTLCVVSGAHAYYKLFAFTFIGSVGYIGTLTYFAVAINSYIHSLDMDRYL